MRHSPQRPRRFQKTSAGNVAFTTRRLRSRWASPPILGWLALVVALGSVSTRLLEAGDTWPQFRGPEGTGVADDSQFPERWSATENVGWKVEVSGRGWSSPIVWGNRLFVTTVVNRGQTATAKKGLYFGGDRKNAPESEHIWKVLCLHVATGEQVWERTAREGVPAQGLHLKNSYASETPVTDGERVYALFGNVGLFCYDYAGELLWSHTIEPHRTRASWGPAASPVLAGDKVLLVNDNEDQSYLLALDKRTGKEVWRVAREEKSNWATPFVWNSGARTEIVTPGTTKVRSYDLDGNPLWEFAGMSVITIATPFAANGLLYVSSGYVLDRNRPLYAIRPGGKGDISLADNTQSNEFIVWRQPTEGPYNPSTLAYQGRLYVLYDRGFLACFDGMTGAPIYGAGNDKQRIPNGRAFTASPWASRGKVYCLNEDGETFVFAAGDKFELLYTNKLDDDEMAMATPAIVGDRLILRTERHLYGIGR